MLSALVEFKNRLYNVYSFLFYRFFTELFILPILLFKPIIGRHEQEQWVQSMSSPYMQTFYCQTGRGSMWPLRWNVGTGTLQSTKVVPLM